MKQACSLIILAGFLAAGLPIELQATAGSVTARALSDEPKPAETKKSTLTGKIVSDQTGEEIPNAVVIARCGTDGKLEFMTRTDDSGDYKFENIPASAGTCLVRATKYLSPEENEQAKLEMEKKVAELAKNLAGKKPSSSVRMQARKDLDPQWKPFETRTLKDISVSGGETVKISDLRLPNRTAGVGEFARAIIGFEQTGASSAPSVQKYFADLWLSVPAPFINTNWKDPNFGPRFQLWGDIRVTSTPQQIQSSIGDFAIQFPTQFGALKVNEVAQAAEFVAGVERRILDWGVTKSRLLSFDQSTRERFGMYFTAGFGTVTPFNPRDTVQVFNNPAPGVEPAFDQQIAALGLTSQLAGKKFVAFVSQDRDKFFRQYYAGIRLKTFYYDRDTDEPQRRFPATLDVVFGQNEAVTGGRLHRVVMRLEGFYPLPYTETNFMYLFGTADLILGRTHVNNAIILQPATNNPPIPDPSILLISTPQLNRDHYRIGVGMDFLQVINKIKSKNDNKPTS